MEYPHKDVYEKLYKRFFVRPVEELIDMAGRNVGKGKQVLDLCCGTGRLSRELANRECRVIAVDKSELMFYGYSSIREWNISFQNISVENYLVRSAMKSEKEVFDAVFCQQAINYWFNNVYTWQLAAVVKSGGCLVFNTFKDKPPTKPVVKEYKIDGVDYVEVYYSVGNEVHHMQSCEGAPIHVTVFEYIAQDEFVKRLSPFFDVYVIESGKTLVFKCFRNNSEAQMPVAA